MADDAQDDTDDEERRRRAAALLAALVLGDWSGLVDEVAEDLTSVYANGPRAVGLTASGQTRNQARANLDLPPPTMSAATRRSTPTASTSAPRIGHRATRP